MSMWGSTQLGAWIFVAALGMLLAATAWLSRRQSVVVRVPARRESIRLLAAILGSSTQDARLGERAAVHCRLALDEACVNIIEHAYANNPSGEIEISIQAAPGMCIISLTDFGEPYDPTRISTPRISRSLDEAQPGGLGLYLMRVLMDEVRYTPGPHGNNLVMVKRHQLS